MAVKTGRLEARVSPEERARIEQASSSSGLSVSAFMVSAAVQRADQIIAESTTTTVPADYYDKLLAALDEAEAAPRLTRAAQRANHQGRITAR
jgi:uncharacterized protein (DUF1778 family)